MCAIKLKDWIMEQWDKNYYISAIAGSNSGSSLVVMSKGKRDYIFAYKCYLSELNHMFLSNVGTPYLQQSYKVSESFPFKWINKKWKEGFHVTAMGTAGNKWAIVMSRGAGFSEQVRICCLDHKFRIVFGLISFISL